MSKGRSLRYSPGQGNPLCCFVELYVGERGAERPTTKSRVSVLAAKDLKPQFKEKICGDCGGRRNSQPHRRVHWRDPQGPKMSTNPLPANQHLKDIDFCGNQGK